MTQIRNGSESLLPPRHLFGPKKWLNQNGLSKFLLLNYHQAVPPLLASYWSAPCGDTLSALLEAVNQPFVQVRISCLVHITSSQRPPLLSSSLKSISTSLPNCLRQQHIDMKPTRVWGLFTSAATLPTRPLSSPLVISSWDFFLVWHNRSGYQNLCQIRIIFVAVLVFWSSYLQPTNGSSPTDCCPWVLRANLLTPPLWMSRPTPFLALQGTVRNCLLGKNLFGPPPSTIPLRVHESTALGLCLPSWERKRGASL